MKAFYKFLVFGEELICKYHSCNRPIIEYNQNQTSVIVDFRFAVVMG
jgi:hypothetical protein